MNTSLSPIYNYPEKGLSGLSPDQAPDEGAATFVRDFLEHRLGENPDQYPDTWIPMTLLGTLDWIMLCNWWAWFYTGIFQSSAAYQYVFRYFSRDPKTGDECFYEFDPDRLVLFEEDPDKNAFEERFLNPGLTDRERGEVIQFVTQDVFKEMDVEPPPQEVMEKIIYCVFIWVLSDNGRAWLCEIDPVWACVDEFRIAYLERWENTLLDPRNVEHTKRPMGSCALCGNQLYCVSGASLFDDWLNLCNDCLILAANNEEAEIDREDRRIQQPLCGFRGGTCYNTGCPHNPITHEDLGDMMAEQGAKRVDLWRKARVEANEPRKLAGRTVQQTVEYFKDVDYEAVLDAIIDQYQNTGKLEDAVEVLTDMLHDPNIKKAETLIRVVETLQDVYAELGRDEDADNLEDDLHYLKATA